MKTEYERSRQDEIFELLMTKGTEQTHDILFGEGSWAELEKGVRARHPFLFSLIESEQLEQQQTKKWWQIWK